MLSLTACSRGEKTRGEKYLYAKYVYLKRLPYSVFLLRKKYTRDKRLMIWSRCINSDEKKNGSKSQKMAELTDNNNKKNVERSEKNDTEIEALKCT